MLDSNCFAICNELFEGWAFTRVCQFAAEVGYGAVELAPFTVADDIRDLSLADRSRLRMDADRAGVSIVGLHWLLVKPAGTRLISTDAAEREFASRYLADLARLCGDLGGKVIILGSPKQRQRPPGVSYDQAVQWLRSTLEPAAAAATSQGVTLCLEPLPAEDTNFLNTLQEVAAIVRAIDHPAIRLILDVKSMGAENRPVPELVRTYGGLAAHFHANDTNRRGPGDGDTDYTPIFTALSEIGYKGAISVEVFDYTPDPETIARRSLTYMKQIIGSG